MYKEYDWSAQWSVGRNIWISCQVLTLYSGQWDSCPGCWPGTRGHLPSPSSVDAPPTVSVCWWKTSSKWSTLKLHLATTVPNLFHWLSTIKISFEIILLKLMLPSYLVDHSFLYQTKMFGTQRLEQLTGKCHKFDKTQTLLQHIYLNWTLPERTHHRGTDLLYCSLTYRQQLQTMWTLTCHLPSLSPSGWQPSSFHSPSRGSHICSAQSTLWWGAAIKQNDKYFINYFYMIRVSTDSKNEHSQRHSIWLVNVLIYNMWMLDTCKCS